MSRQKTKKTRSKTRKSRPSIKPQRIDIKPEDLARYAQQAEQQAVPLIKEMEMSAGAALAFLAQYTQVLISGNQNFTVESVMTITNSVLALWQSGSYRPSAQYPFTLEETLQDIKEGLKAKEDYSKYFQPFTPSDSTPPVGIGRVAGGIVQHPKTLLWQTWMIMDGPCAFLGAYRDSNEAQRNLERVINTARYGSDNTSKRRSVADEAKQFYTELISRGDGKPVQIPFDMMNYLMDHLHLYTIDL